MKAANTFNLWCQMGCSADWANAQGSIIQYFKVLYRYPYLPSPDILHNIAPSIKASPLLCLAVMAKVIANRFYRYFLPSNYYGAIWYSLVWLVAARVVIMYFILIDYMFIRLLETDWTSRYDYLLWQVSYVIFSILVISWNRYCFF